MNAKLVLNGVEGSLMQFQSNHAAQTAGFVVALTDPSGQPVGQIQIAVGPQPQPESDTQHAIPAYQEMLASSEKAQALFAALQEFGLELVTNYSKIIDVQVAE